MFKKKAFLISLALLASNFLLPNQVRSGLEVGEEITSETQEVNFKIERPYEFIYEGSLMLNNGQTMGTPYCFGETLDEFINSCMEKNYGSSDNLVRVILSLSASELLFNLREEEVSLEIGEEITSETQEVNFKIVRPYGVFYEGYLLINNRLSFGTPICSKETLDEFIYSCMEKYQPGSIDNHIRDILSLSMSDLLLNLREEEQDIEDEVEIEEDVVVLEEEVEEEVEEVETTEAEDIDFDSITKADLPLKVYCPDRGADLIIREKKKKKGYVVKITRRRGERFFDGRKFRKAVKKFKKALENEC